MELENENHHHHDHHLHMVEDFRKRFWLSALLTVPILSLSPPIQKFLGAHWQFTGAVTGDAYVLWFLSSIVFFYGGLPFLKGIFDEMKKFKRRAYRPWMNP